MSANPRHLNYSFGGHDEACLAFGPDNAARRILIIPPLFDEMNRVRAMLVTAMRDLAGRGIATMLPDIPGCNESLANISSQTPGSWQAAMTAAAGQLTATHVASIRGGALIDAAIALPHWRLAPAKGTSLLKTMLRTRIAADKEAGKTSSADSLMASAQTGPIELSGYMLGGEMLAGLDAALPDTSMGVHEMSLGEEPGQLWGKPIWLRAEPQEDPDMSAALAAELDRWSASCGG